MLACRDHRDWFGVKSPHALHDVDVLRFRAAWLAAFEFVNPPPKKKG